MMLNDVRKYRRKGKQRRREIKRYLLNAIKKQEKKGKSRKKWAKRLMLNDGRK